MRKIKKAENAVPMMPHEYLLLSATPGLLKLLFAQQHLLKQAYASLEGLEKIVKKDLGYTDAELAEILSAGEKEIVSKQFNDALLELVKGNYTAEYAKAIMKEWGFPVENRDKAEAE